VLEGAPGREPVPADREQVVESLSPVLDVLDHALRGHRVLQGATVDYVLHAGPPAGVRVPSRAVRVDRDPAVLMHQPPDERVRVDGVPAPAHVEVQHGAQVLHEGDPDQGGGLPPDLCSSIGSSPIGLMKHVPISTPQVTAFHNN